MKNPLKPELSLLRKLGEFIVCVEDMMYTGHICPDCSVRLCGLLNDSEIKEWRARMDEMLMLPLKRKGDTN